MRINATSFICLKRARQGFVLLAVLVFILLLSMVTLSLLFRSKGDESAGFATIRSEQAWASAMSGVEEAMRVAGAAVPGDTGWQDDASTFKARPVYLDGGEQWYFTVFTPAEADALVDTRYGLSDAAAFINLNHPGKADLTKLPNFSTSLASALRQFIGVTFASPTAGASSNAPTPSDFSSNVSPANGADVTSSTTGNPIPYHGPLATLDELLLLPGVTPALLHGAPPVIDLTIAPSTTNQGPQLPMEFSKPKRDRGMEQYFTVFGRDPNLSSRHQTRCNINDTNSAYPACDLPAGFSNYVAAVRATGTQLEDISQALEATIKLKDERGVDVEIASEITKENLPTLLDLFATDGEAGHDGRINVNTANAAVLATQPGIDVPLAESIVSTRTGLNADRRATIAWLYQEGLVDADKFKIVAPNLTTRSAQFRFNVIGYSLPAGNFRVLDAVIDAAGSAPRIVYLRDITRLGLPISLKEENPASVDGKSGSTSSSSAPHG